MATMKDLQEQLEKLTTDLQSREVYFPPKEKKIKSFNGMDGASVDDFVEDMRAGLNLRRLQGIRAVDYITAHLEGAARQEIKHRPATEKGDAEAILRILQDTFGDRLTLGQLMRRVYNRVQKEDETVADYAYALLSLKSRIEGKANAPDCGKTVIEQFHDGLNDPVLRREVKRVVKEKLGLSSLEVRDWAVEMEEGDSSTLHKRKRAAVCQAEATLEMGEMVEGLAAALKSQTEILSQIRSQQDTLNSRLDRIESQEAQPRMRPPPRDKRDVVCYRCGNRGHYAKECALPEGSAPVPPTSSSQKGSPGQAPPMSQRQNNRYQQGN